MLQTKLLQLTQSYSNLCTLDVWYENNDCSAGINQRINMASQRVGRLKTLLSISKSTVKTKINVLVYHVSSHLFCAAEAQTKSIRL